MTNLEYYDLSIAPILAELAVKCRERGMSFVSGVEYEPGSVGETRFISDNATFATILAAMAVAAVGNIDVFLIAVQKYAKEHGHSSVYLQMLGDKWTS